MIFFGSEYGVYIHEMSYESFTPYGPMLTKNEKKNHKKTSKKIENINK